MCWWRCWLVCCVLMFVVWRWRWSVLEIGCRVVVWCWNGCVWEIVCVCWCWRLLGFICCWSEVVCFCFRFVRWLGLFWYLIGCGILCFLFWVFGVIWGSCRFCCWIWWWGDYLWRVLVDSCCCWDWWWWVGDGWMWGCGLYWIRFFCWMDYGVWLGWLVEIFWLVWLYFFVDWWC